MAIPLILTAPVPSSTLSGHITIDSSTNDNGYLEYARNNNPRAGRHESTNRVASNLRGGVSNEVIVGHGTRGLIVTGTGQSVSDRKKYVSLWNQGEWRESLSRLSGSSSTLHLYACHPGTSSDGANFLYNLARVVNCPVLGPTGFIYVDRQGQFTLEPGSTWQIATPSHRPDPIEAPTPYFKRLTDRLLVVKNKKLKRYKIDSVLSFSFISLFRDPTNRKPILSVRGAEAQEILRRIGLTEPFRIPGVAGALVTGKIRVKLRDDYEKSLIILNDRMLQDKKYPNVYYYVSGDISSIVHPGF